MLLECNNCGAPLDVDGQPDVVKCGYCGASASLAHLRTLAARTPPDWQRPKSWTPPKHVPADSSHTYRYRGGRKGFVPLAVAGAALLAFAGLGLLVGARSDGLPTDGSCPSTFIAAGQQRVTCHCRAPFNSGSASSSGNVWGTTVYTADSSVCRAARHAGAIGAAGGEVEVKSAAGCASYAGSFANGVETHSWGAYGQSFYFEGYGDGRCGASASAASAVSVGGICPTTFYGSQGQVTCTCTPNLFTGSVWGAGTYTSDSSLCQAALHAGAVTREGGEVIAHGAPGCAAYAGNSRNGVTTGSWKQYHSSFYFQGYGSGTCE